MQTFDEIVDNVRLPEELLGAEFFSVYSAQPSDPPPHGARMLAFYDLDGFVPGGFA